jgi:flavodoxin
MKTLIVYYSLDGNCHFIAETLAAQTQGDLLRLKLKDEIKSDSWTKFIWGGKQVMMKEKPELLTFEKNPLDYDLIIIGTPVWAWHYAPALNTFFEKVKLTNKKIAVFCCHGGQPGNTLKLLKEQLIGNENLGEIDFKEPLKNDKQQAAALAKNWIINLTK